MKVVEMTVGAGTRSCFWPLRRVAWPKGRGLWGGRVFKGKELVVEEPKTAPKEPVPVGGWRAR